MPRVYSSGEKIPEFGAAIHGGISLAMHRPAEMEYPRALCAMAANSNSPMHSIYGLLDVGSKLDESQGGTALNVPKKMPLASTVESPAMHWSEIGETDLSHDAMALAATLSFAQELWSKEPGEFNAVLAIARPDSPDGSELKVEAGKPALVLHRGSVLATFTSRAALSALKFAVLLFPTTALFPTQKAERIMEDFRDKALRTPGVEPLQRFEALPENALLDSKSVIVVVHGLLSIDVGLFDPLIAALRTSLGSECDFIGFPHNTLTAINTNGELLMREIERTIGTDGPNVAFLCHSRGGLVVRSAAAQLFKKEPSYRQNIRGCVTFGTPHEGCPMAEAPDDFLGAFIAVQAARGGNGFFSLANAIGYAHLEKSLDGIRDLRPSEAKDSYLIKLRDLERATAPNKGERALPILAVGGQAAEQSGLLASVARRLLAGPNNDLVVETRSSMSRFINLREQTNCNHFDYFKPEQMNLAHIQQVQKFLTQVLAYQPASVVAISTPATADGDQIGTEREVTRTRESRKGTRAGTPQTGTFSA